MKATAEAFIRSLVRKCTYLNDEQVLPKNSLLYERFEVLNELNNLRINGERLSAAQKQDIFNTLFLRGKKVSRKSLINHLIGRGILKSGMEEQVSGIDGDFKSSLSSYGKFYGVVGDALKRDDMQKMVEKIIFWGTVYGDDKKFFLEKVEEEYSDQLTREQLKKIKGFKFKDWGRLSAGFLGMTGCNKSDGEVLPLIERMWIENVNLMEVMSERYTYHEELCARINEAVKSLSELEYDDLEGMYLSAPVKRMIWQTILILNEIVSVMGYEPQKLFVEMARADGEKGKRTISRKRQLEELYKKCKKDPIIKELADGLRAKDEKDLRAKKLYLYYIQKGRCMYTGDMIAIDELDDKYDIDHIYPRQVVKDDSIHNNLVLVKKEANAEKSNVYPLAYKIYEEQNPFWTSLLNSGFITREKYNRLVCRTPFTDEQLAGFIQRQIVETSQSTKAVAHLMENAFNIAEVVYVKSGLVADFRKDCKNLMKYVSGVAITKETDDDARFYQLLKSRTVNDYHHAQDAYLNIVVGNVYQVKFTKSPINFIKNNDKRSYHMDKVFLYDVKRSNEIAWVAKGENATLNVVLKMMEKNTPIITRMSYEAHGALYKATMWGKSTAAPENYIPLKASDKRMQDVTKYGGYTSVSGAYFFLVEHIIKKKKVRTLESMPIYLAEKNGQDSKALQEYCVNVLGMTEPNIRMKKIKFQSLLKINGYYVHLSARTGKQISLRNAISLSLERKWINYVKKIENCLEKGLVEKDIVQDKNIELYKLLTQKMKNTIFSRRPNPVGEKLKEGTGKFEKLSIEEQCKVLTEILKLTAIGITKDDIRLIGGGKDFGTMKISKNISNASEFKQIYQSPTGLYQKEVDLLTI